MDQASQLRKLIESRRKEISRNRVKIITVSSGKGGVGKTNTSVNLAIQLKRLGQRVVILDADFGLANVEVLFGIAPKYDLSDIIFNNKCLKEIMTRGPLGIEFISGGSGIQELTSLSEQQLEQMVIKLSELDYLTDVIIVDTGAGISNSVLKFLEASDEVIIVTTPEPTSITDSYALLKTLKRTNHFSGNTKVINIVTNRVKNKKEGEMIFNKLNRVSERFLDIKISYLGYVPQDKNMYRAVVQQKPVSILYPSSSASLAINNIAKRIISDNYSYNKQEKKEDGGMSSFLKKILKKG